MSETTDQPKNERSGSTACSSRQSRDDIAKDIARATLTDWVEVASALDHLEATCIKATSAVFEFAKASYGLACVTYRNEIGKLPGSERTSRLRKKRRKLVMHRVAKLFAD